MSSTFTVTNETDIVTGASNFMSTLRPDDNMTTKMPVIFHDPRTKDALAWYRYSDMTFLYGGLATSLVGLILNSLVIAVILKSSMRSTTVGYYMIGTAVADNIMLAFGTLNLLNGPTVGVYLLDKNNVLCKITDWMGLFGRQWSYLILCIITLERFVVVAFPLKVGKIMTLTMAKVNLAVTGIISLGINSHILITEGLVFSPNGQGRYVCTYLTEYAHIYHGIARIVYQYFGQYGVIIFLSLFSFLIVLQLVRAKKVRKSMATGSQNSTTASQATKVQKEKQITIMLLSIIIAFIIANLPATVVYTYTTYWIRGGHFDRITYYYLISAYLLFNLLPAVNASINFLLYYAFGSNFRRSTKLLFGGTKNREPSTVNLQLSSIQSNN